MEYSEVKYGPIRHFLSLFKFKMAVKKVNCVKCATNYIQQQKQDVLLVYRVTLYGNTGIDYRCYWCYFDLVFPVAILR